MRNVFYIVLMFAIISCDKKNKTQHGAIEKEIVWKGKHAYTYRVFGLFKPDELVVELHDPNHCEIFFDGRKVKVSGRMSVRRSNAGRIAIRINEKEFQSNEFQLCAFSGNTFYGKFSLSLPNKIKREFIGGLQLKMVEGQVSPIVSMRLEDAVTCITTSESSSDDPSEYLKAQSVVSRSFILGNSHRHSDYDFCDNTHCQVFFGLDHVTEENRNILLQTKGFVLTYQEKILPALYSGACGGNVVSPSAVWKQEAIAYDPPDVSCMACSTSQYYKWSRELSVSDLSRALGIESTDVENIEIDSSAKPRRINFTSGKSGMTFPVDEFRLRIGRALGWNKILSNWFSLNRTNNTLYVHGRGFGHGVGLCQEGAKSRARTGMNFKETLMYYFPGADIRALHQQPD